MVWLVTKLTRSGSSPVNEAESGAESLGFELNFMKRRTGPPCSQRMVGHVLSADDARCGLL